MKDMLAFEVMDRTYMIMEQMKLAFGDHEAVRKNPEMKALVVQVESTLDELYQLASHIVFNDNKG
jgi:hypothetical protein